MSTKKKAVGKAAKSPTVAQLRAEIATDEARETHLKHEAAEARRPKVRKHDLARARSLGKKVASLKHEVADKTKKRGLALSPGDVPCCAAQALAESLRLALGAVVPEQDVLALYWRTAAGPDEGAPILATLEAAREYGIGGHFPAGWRPARGLDRERSVLLGLELPDMEPESWIEQAGLGIRSHPGPRWTPPAAPAYDDPGASHTVAVGPDGAWWSWGEPWEPTDFGGAVIDEAWAVQWAGWPP
jgi:hypothetical protein